MKPRTALKRYTPIRKRRLTPRNRKTVVRLTGAAIGPLRWQCYSRDRGRCKICGVTTHYIPFYDGDPLAFDMAHIKSRGAGGSDNLSNLVTKCHRDHMAEHAGRKS